MFHSPGLPGLAMTSGGEMLSLKGRPMTLYGRCHPSSHGSSQMAPLQDTHSSSLSGGHMTTLTGVMRDAILQLCRENISYGGHMEVDGIICISGQSEHQQIVVKVHEKLYPEVDLQKRQGGAEEDEQPTSQETALYAKRPRLDKDNDSDSLIDVEGDEDGKEVPPVDDDLEVEGVHLSRKRKEPVLYVKEEADQNSSSSPYPLSGVTSSPRGAMDLTTSRLSVSPFSDVESQSYPPGYVESRLRNLLTKSPSMHRPHNMLPFLQRRPMYSTSPTTMMMSHSSPECKTCGLIVSEPEMLKEHNETHHGVFTCRICYRTFTSRSNLERHSRLHTGHKPYICNKCGKAFSRKDHLTNHSAKHAFKCGKCLKRFVERDALRLHYARDHNAELSDICTFCNKGFTDSRAYSEHLKTHPENFKRNERPNDLQVLTMKTRRYTHKCSECGMMYADALDLARHQRTTHMLYYCLGCNDSFADPIIYSQHFIAHQDHMNIFECFACRQICTTYQELREHEQTHSSMSSKQQVMVSDMGETDTYLCPYCAKVFPNESLLMEHVSIHEGLQRHTCSSCGERFDSLEALEAHDEQHHEEANGSAKLDDADGRESPPSSKSSGSIREKSLSPSRDRSEPPCEPLERKLKADQSDNDENGDDSKNFVVTENPTLVIEISGNHSDVSMDQDQAGSEGKSESSHGTMRATQSVENRTSPPPTLSPAPGSSTDEDKRWYSIKNHNNAYMIPVPTSGFLCSICGVRLQVFKDYEGHCFTSHYRYPCMYCPKTFAQRPNRDRHVCIHTGEKPFSCPECNQKFSRGDKLKIHRMKAHNLDYPGPYVRLKDASKQSEGEDV